MAVGLCLTGRAHLDATKGFRGGNPMKTMLEEK